jgi:hypothetical protein
MSRRTRVRLGIALIVFIAGAIIDLARPCSGYAYCTGDCDANGTVSSGEYVDCRGIAFGSRPLSQCARCDCDENGIVSDAEWMRAEQNALNGCSAGECPGSSPTLAMTPTTTATPTVTGPTPSRTATGSQATATVAASATPSVEVTTTVVPGGCVGDCDADDSVVVNELVTGVNIALERSAVSVCSPFDVDQSASVSVNELVQAVNNLLRGCP